MSFPRFEYDDRFTELETQMFRDLFQFFDRRGDQTIDVRDLGKAMRSVGALLSDHEVKILVQKYDPRGSGFVSFVDFLSCMAEVQAKPDGEENIRNAFSVFDKYDDSQSMSLAEMKHVLSTIGDPIPEEDLEDFFKYVD